MYRAFTKTLALVVFTAAALTACKKDKDEAVEPTKENLAGTYTLSSSKSKINGGEIDDMAQMDACNKDDEYTLKADGTFIYTDAGTACVPDDSYTGTWSVSGKTISTPEVSGNIDSFNGKTLVIYLKEVANGITYESTMVLNKK